MRLELRRRVDSPNETGFGLLLNDMETSTIYSPKMQLFDLILYLTSIAGLWLGVDMFTIGDTYILLREKLQRFLQKILSALVLHVITSCYV